MKREEKRRKKESEKDRRTEKIGEEDKDKKRINMRKGESK